MKSIRTILAILIAAFAAVGLGACMSDDEVINNENTEKDIAEIFEKMKGTYTGNLAMPDNSQKTLKFQINQQAQIVISSFPMENILYQVYGNDYLNVTMSAEAVGYTDAIDSVGVTTNTGSIKNQCLAFVAQPDLMNPELHFSFTKDGQSHSGWANIRTRGIYDPVMEVLDINFIVEDLVIDGVGYEGKLPAGGLNQPIMTASKE